MSGNQESRISLPTWRCSDFNAAIPIKKRKYFVQPQLPAMEEAASKNPQPNEQGDSSVGRSALDSSVENQKIIGDSMTNIGEPVPSLPSVSVGNADKVESTGDISVDQIRVKVEQPNFPIAASALAGSQIPSSSNILGTSLGKLPVTAEHPGVVLETHEIVREKCGKENLRGECQAEASASADTVSMQLGCKTKKHWENEETIALNLSLSKGVCAPCKRDSISICAKSGDLNGVNRSNWDLNTTMDAWEDPLDRRTRVKTAGAFLNSNKTLDDIETSSCRDTTAIAKSISEKPKESGGFKSPALSLVKFDNQVNPTCSLSLGLSTCPPVEKSPSLSATTSEARAACTSLSIPITAAGNANSVNLRTVKSEIMEESVRQETENAQVCPIGLSINSVKHEAVGRLSQEKSPSSGILKSVDLIPVKAEPINFTLSEVINWKDGALNHSHAPIVQSNEIRDLPTSSSPNQRDKCIPYSSGICNEMTTNPGVRSYPDSTLKESSVHSSSAANGKLCEVLKDGGVGMTSGGDHNLNASGVNVSCLTEAKTLDDCKISISEEVPRNSHGTEGNEVAHAECSGFETEQRDTAVPFHGNFQNSNHLEEKGSQPAVLGNTVEMASTKVRLTPELQRGIFDGSGENEGRIVQDGEQSTHRIIHASEGMSGVSTVSGGNIENRETIDNSSPISYKVEISTIEDDPPAELSEGSQSRIINLAQVSNNSPNKTLDASDSFVPLQMERDRLPDYPFEPRKYPLRGSDESCKFSRERYSDKIMRSPRLNFMPDRRRFSDQAESNLHDRDTKSFEFDNHGNTRRGGTFMSNFHRGRRPANDEGTPFSHSFQRRTPNFSFTHRGPRNKEDVPAYHGFRDGEKFTRGSQCNTEPMFMSPHRPYRGRNGGFTRGRTKFTNNSKREFPGFRSRSPVRSRERSPGPSSSFRNRSQEDFSGHTDFSHRRSPAGYRTERISSPDHSGYTRDTVVRRHNSPPPYSHRPSNAGRGRGYVRGRGYARGQGYARGRGYGRDGNSFRKPYDRVLHRNHGNLNKLDPRERVDYNDDFVEGPIHSERFGIDVNVERRRFGYRHDGTSSFMPSFNNDGCAATNVENDSDAVRLGHDSDMEIEEQGSLMETDGKNKNSTENASGTKNVEEEETSKHGKVWQPDEPGGGNF